MPVVRRNHNSARWQFRSTVQPMLNQLSERNHLIAMFPQVFQMRLKKRNRDGHGVCGWGTKTMVG
jgi:hypothetical protein